MIDLAWIRPVVKHRASTHTERAPEGFITNQGKLIKGAIEDVFFICMPHRGIS